MTVDLMRANVAPKPLEPFSTKDAKIDAALAKLQRWEHAPSDPRATPGGPDYDATVRIAKKAPVAALLALLDDDACDCGRAHWDDEAYDKLGTKEKKAFRAHYDAVALAQHTRTAYLTFLMQAVLPKGLDRVIAIATSPKIRPETRVAAADVLFWRDDPKEQDRIGEALDPHRWDGKDGTGQHCKLWRVYRAGACVLARRDPKKAFDRLSDLLTPEAIKPAAGRARAGAALSGLMHAEAIDARWNAHLAKILRSPLEHQVLMTLLKAPPDPALVEPLCAYLGKSPEKVTYFADNAVRLLARSATPKATPWLAAALRASWMHYPAAFEGFRKAGDPAMAPVIRAWLKDNGDGPKGERTKLGEAVARALEAKAKKAGVAIPEYTPPEPKAKPAPKRPVLVYKSCKPMKLPKLESLATLEQLFEESFAKAGLSAHYPKIAQRAVWLVPTRVDEKKLAIGTTKLGGHPDLDAKTEWPRVEGEPLTFLAQIRLEEMAPHLPKGLAPPAGLLAFFVGNDPNSKRAGYLEQARVLFIPPKAKLARREAPDDFTDLIYQACSVRPIATIKLPSPSNKHVTRLLKKDAWRRYADDVFAPTPALPQFLGYRDHGWDAEEPSTAQMLLQLTGDDQSDMEFGDCDFLSLFMDEKKLRAGDFSKVWPHVGD